MRFIARAFGALTAAQRRTLRMLDVGCGSGAGTWFLAREGYTVCGIDGSRTALQRARERARTEGLRMPVVRADIARLPVLDASIDCVVDVHAVQHNRSSEAREILREIGRVLRSGGRFFSMLAARGTSVGDGGHELGDGTYTDLASGPFAGLGTIRLYDEAAVRELVADLADVALDRSERTDHSGRLTIRTWIVSARKP